jgi:uncharacterized membrane protein (UPF0127 family)
MSFGVGVEAGRNLLHVPQRLVNRRTGKVVFRDVMTARRMSQRTKGLLGTTVLAEGRALLIPRARQVHTIGMRYPLDLVFCDRSLEVVAVRRNVAPWRVTPIVWRARSVIECASGGAEGIVPGDALELQPIER